MEVQPYTFEVILDAFGKQALTHQKPIIPNARIAVTPQNVQLLEVQPTWPMEIIRY